jgi:hypothetical protein
VVVEAWLPWQTLRAIPMQKVEEVAARVPPEFVDLSTRYPESFRKHFGEPTSQSFARALRLGRDVYSAEACWHCHSQYVRPVSNEDRRFGAISYPGEYQNELQLPQLFGTRRVGPDLIRSSGKHSNDWHVAHFWEPTQIVPSSVMPSFRWFFDPQADPSQPPQPNDRGLAIVAFVQWLGSWAEQPDAPLLPVVDQAAAASAGPGSPGGEPATSPEANAPPSGTGAAPPQGKSAGAGGEP